MKQTMRINLADAVDDFAPLPPPCWPDRMSWIEYLKSAAACQHKSGNSRVILMRADGPTVDTEFDFFSDCLSTRAARMQKAGSCQPDALKTANKETPQHERTNP